LLYELYKDTSDAADAVDAALQMDFNKLVEEINVFKVSPAYPTPTSAGLPTDSITAGDDPVKD
jgi:hypothetical protein